jgi:hypothetical protein
MQQTVFNIRNKKFRLKAKRNFDFYVFFLIALKVSSLITCSILQASTLAVSSGTPNDTRYLVKTVCRS